MSLNEVEFQELVDFYDHVRIPLSGMEREKRQGPYRYYGAQSVIDHVDDFLFDGEYVLIAEDGANLVTRNEPIAQVVSGQFWVNNHAHIVQAKEGVSTNNFINFLINTNNISGYVTGAAQPKLSQKNLRVIKFEVPSYEDQLAIDELISKYDDLIENNKRRIELLEESARQLYKEWFVRFRFPGHEHVKIIDGVPEGWTSTTLGAVATTNALSHKAKELPEEIKYIDISSVSTGRILTKNHMVSEDAPGRARRSSRHGDVIWSNVRPNLRAYALVLHPEDIDVFSTGFTVLSGTEIPYSFLYNFTTTDNFVNHLVNHTTGASYPAVRPPDFERAELLLPPQSLLEQFHEICEPNFELCYMLSEQNVQLAAARDLLLPKLMNGEIAV